MRFSKIAHINILFALIKCSKSFSDSTLNELNVVKIQLSDAKGKLVEGDIVGPMPKMGRSGIIDPNARWPSNTVVYELDPSFRKI